MTDRTEAMDNLIALDADLIDKLRDEDSYYRVQEKHWCIDAEELERQRLAAADLIETQAREIERLKERVKRLENYNRELRGFKEPVYAATDLRAALGESHDQ